MAETQEDKRWYTVRCVFRMHDKDPADEVGLYEERLTLWQAGSLDEAIELVEAEAAEYLADDSGAYVGLAQAFHMFDSPVNGREVFSLIRDSELPPQEYIDRFFDTGRERQQHWQEG